MATLKSPLTASDHSRGNKKASIVIVEYGDYQCPYCGEAFGVLKKLEETFKDKILFAFRHFPLTQVHEYAQMAAETAEFAASHQKFWDMHNLIFQNQDQLSQPFLLKAVESLGLSAKDWEKAINDDVYTPIVKEQFMSGVKSGVNGTPTLFINNNRYSGPLQFKALSEYLKI